MVGVTGWEVGWGGVFVCGELVCLSSFPLLIHFIPKFGVASPKVGTLKRNDRVAIYYSHRDELTSPGPTNTK